MFNHLVLIFVIVGILGSSVRAEAQSRFSAASFVEGIGSAMLTDLGKKLRELGGTYSFRQRGDYEKHKKAEMYFFAYKAPACGKDSVTGPVASLDYTAVTIEGALSQRIYYRGCDQKQLQFAELIQTRGGDQKLLTEDQILSAQRVFTLQGSENFRKYAILDGEQTEIFSFTTTRSGSSQWRTVITFKQATLAYIYATQTKDGEKVEIRKIPKAIVYRTSKGQITYFDSSSLHIGIHWVRGNQIYYDLNSGDEISFSMMEGELMATLRNGVSLGLFKKVINAHMADFPASEPPPSVSRIKNELTLLLAQVLANPSGPEIPQLVQNLINILLTAINEGRIIDSRPVE